MKAKLAKWSIIIAVMLSITAMIVYLMVSHTKEMDKSNELDTPTYPIETNPPKVENPSEDKGMCYLNFSTALKGGKVVGELHQEVRYGGKGSTVVAIPDEGYRFVRWSDGQTEAIRRNLYVTYELGVPIYAEFERFSRLFAYHYNEATSTSVEKEVLISLDNLNSLRLSVPEREGYKFKGWYSDWHHTMQVSDEFGNLIVGKDWLQGEWWYDTQINLENNLYAKWEAEKEIPTYKILLIFVTEVHGEFETNNGKSDVIRVDFVMSEIQKRVCMKVAQRLETYLEAILNSTVNFEIDSYFTQEPLTRENFYHGLTWQFLTDYGIDIRHNGIPEVNNIIGNYGSVLTTFSLDDHDGELMITAGKAEAKFGEINFGVLEPNFSQTDDVTYETVYFDETYPGVFRGWANMMSFYIHEFAHTVEFQLNAEDCYGIHEAGEYYGQMNGPLATEYLMLVPYLRGEFESEKGKVGIPYSFWDGTYAT